MANQGSGTAMGKKVFVPLENNPRVMTDLAHQLGASSNLGFQDVYSIDDTSLLEFIPRPAHALLFTAPTRVYTRARGDEQANMPVYCGSGEEEPVVWYKQTIGNACGLIALLHALSNGEGKKHIVPGSVLATLLEEAIPLQPDARADLLYNSSALEAAHQAAAQKGDSEAPPAEDENYNHFICFVKADDGHLWELNGGMNGPLDRGALDNDEDVLSERALQLSVREFLGKAGSQDVAFSLLVLTLSLD